MKEFLKNLFSGKYKKEVRIARTSLTAGMLIARVASFLGRLYK